MAGGEDCLDVWFFFVIYTYTATGTCWRLVQTLTLARTRSTCTLSNVRRIIRLKLFASRFYYTFTLPSVLRSSPLLRHLLQVPA